MLFLLFLAVLSILEYRPAEVEYLTVENRAEKTQKVEPGKEMTLLCWNIGYGGLGKEMDFFMDGGTKVGPDSKEKVEDCLEGIENIIDSFDPNLILLQEVDSSSSRTSDLLGQ